MSDYISPKYKVDGFNCPNCNAYAHQEWHTILLGTSGGYVTIRDLNTAICQKCNKHSIWFDGKMVHPKITNVPLPNSDLPDDSKYDYLEARNIASDSPRGTSALLRLAIEKLIKTLVEKDEGLDKNIGKLVENGLSKDLQKALDTVRVIGNNAIHPGKLDMRDDVGTAEKLFKLVNIITQQMISNKKEVDELFEIKVSDSEKKHIKKRDNK